MTSYAIVVVFVPPGVICCADCEFGVRLSSKCVEIGSLGSKNTQRKNDYFNEKLFFEF